jgi:hypothetical protein
LTIVKLDLTTQDNCMGGGLPCSACQELIVFAALVGKDLSLFGPVASAF